MSVPKSMLALLARRTATLPTESRRRQVPDGEQGSGRQRRVARGNGRGEVGGWTWEIAIGWFDVQALPSCRWLQDPALCRTATSWLGRACIVRSN